jgi:hypothetical protein
VAPIALVWIASPPLAMTIGRFVLQVIAFWPRRRFKLRNSRRGGLFGKANGPFSKSAKSRNKSVRKTRIRAILPNYHLVVKEGDFPSNPGPNPQKTRFPNFFAHNSLKNHDSRK